MEVRQALGKFREVFLAEKTLQTPRISQLGTEEELVQLSRHPTQLGTEHKSNICNYQDCHLRFFFIF